MDRVTNRLVGLRAAASALLLVGLVGATPGPAWAADPVWTQVDAPTISGFRDLLDVAGSSGTDVWAVGQESVGGKRPTRTLILHWNGTDWVRVASPSPGESSKSHDTLESVAVQSEELAWAVGYFGPDAASKTLIARWDGTRWARVPSPNPGKVNRLHGVTTRTAKDAWAVGESFDKAGNRSPLILHWNGSRWSRVATPRLPVSRPGFGGGGDLQGVVATSARSAWAVGSYELNYQLWPLILRWNGVRWKRVVSPQIPARPQALLQDVDASSATDVWAVGATVSDRTLALHFDGTRWTRVASPNPTPDRWNFLEGIQVLSPTDAWLAGWYAGNLTLVAHWNGTEWARVSTPNPAPVGGANDTLMSIAAISATDLWAVGRVRYYDPKEQEDPLTVHCC